MKPKFHLIFFILSIFNFISLGQGFNMKLMSNVTGLPGGDASAIFGYTSSSGEEYAIIGSKTAINVYNVNDCSNPVHVVSHYDGDNTSWREFATYQNYLYAICDVNCSSGMFIFNMDSIHVSLLQFTQQTNVFLRGHTIFIEKEEGRLYIMGSRNASNQNRLLIYTLDTEVVNGVTYNGTPENPVLIREFLTPYIHDMHVKNNIGYASYIYEFVMRVLDLNNVSNIPEIYSYNYGSGSGKYNYSSWLADDGETLFKAVELPRGEPLRMFKKIGGQQELEFLGNIHEPLEFPNQNTRPHNPHINGDLMYVSYYEDGVQVFDISNLSNANTVKRIAYYDNYTQNNENGYPSNFFGCWGVYPFLPSGCILASDINNGLFTLNLDLSVDDGAEAGAVSLVENRHLSFSSSLNSVVLRSEKGYCFKIKVNEVGDIFTQRILCHTNNETSVKLFKNDIAFNNKDLGVLIKNDLSEWYRLKMSDTGNFEAKNILCSTISDVVEIEQGDLIVETPTKGLIMANRHGCHRILVQNSGHLIVVPLNTYS